MNSSYQWPEDDSDEIILSREHVNLLLKEEAEASRATYSKFNEFLRTMKSKQNHLELSFSSFEIPGSVDNDVDARTVVDYSRSWSINTTNNNKLLVLNSNNLTNVGHSLSPFETVSYYDTSMREGHIGLSTNKHMHTEHDDDAHNKLKAHVSNKQNMHDETILLRNSNFCTSLEPMRPKPTLFSSEETGCTNQDRKLLADGFEEIDDPIATTTTSTSNLLNVSADGRALNECRASMRNDRSLQAKCNNGLVPSELKHYLRSMEEANLVDHTYFDFSFVDDSLINNESIIIGQNLKAVLKGEDTSLTNDIVISGKIMRNIQTFPMRLMDMLSRPEVSSVITWLPHGRSFIVRDPKTLEKDFIPRFFKPMKFKSFLRQVVSMAKF